MTRKIGIRGSCHQAVPSSSEGKRIVDGDSSNIAHKKPAKPAAGEANDELKEITKKAMASIRRAKQAGALTPHQAEAISAADTKPAGKTNGEDAEVSPPRPTFWLP
jgi:hypothetical protein